MQLGKYTETPIDFNKYLVTRPKLTFYNNSTCNFFGCGPSAGACLTGISVDKISALNQDKPHFPLDLMYKFLESQKITVIPLSVADLSNSKEVKNNITKNHLLLLTQMYSKQNASYTILLNLEYIIHNFVINLCRADEFINRPILSASILYRKDWR